MASTPAATPDTPVTLKVNYNGATRRFKLPLRDLGASSLEDKLRLYLDIPADASCLFERYSDSAASYVVLDRSNVSVYKQLYRAAKAKQKLKLRVITKEDIIQVTKGPKPVTIEDEPEPSTQAARTSESLPSPTSATKSPAVGGSSSHQTQNSALEEEIAKLEASLARQGLLSPTSTPPAVKESNEIPVTVGPAPTKFSANPGSVPITAAPRSNYAVCCNSCDRTIPDAHYHCSTCDDGDFDLCLECVEQGISCYGTDHWLIKRSLKNGVIVNSHTETIAPKPKKETPAPADTFEKAERALHLLAEEFLASRTDSRFVRNSNSVRTCNSCVMELPEHDFLHCTSCADFDLCKTCFAKDEHGHHPKHGFEAAVEGTTFTRDVMKLLGPGRYQKHNAICDGCDKFIFGIRHKCLDCPDWDYCSDCVVNAGFIHPNHRFVPIYEQVSDVRARNVLRATHFGICCDGPLCRSGRNASAYIIGDRYKCAVCHDTDFCANCEASPANTHNKTHPLIKFKTPVRHVSVTTTGEHADGNQMPAMGDRYLRNRPSTSSRATETTLGNQGVAATAVQTVVSVQPSEPAAPVKNEEEEHKQELKDEAKVEPAASLESVPAAPVADDLVALFERDTVADGSILPPNHVFEQTWVLRNAGTVSWPAGCSVKFVGGDYMGHVDPKHPAGIHELVSASESTVCYAPLAPGQEFPFTVLLRTPAREGKVISYWRLTTNDGMKFGHRLWCDVDVQDSKVKEEVQEAPVPAAEEAPVEPSAPKVAESQMIFPKLEKESPVSSIHEEVKAESVKDEVEQEADDFEDVDEWAEDESEDGFMTDEEYDILDASDEEYLEEQQKKALQK